MPRPQRTLPVSSISTRTPAQASVILKKQGVAPLLKTVGGKKVERALSAPPESSGDEDVVAESDCSQAHGRQSASKRINGKAQHASTASKPAVKARPAPSKRARTRNTTTSHTATKPIEDDGIDENERHFWALNSSQTMKKRTYASQEIQNIHAPAKSSNQIPPLREQKSSLEQRPFKRPRLMLDGVERKCSVHRQCTPQEAKQMIGQPSRHFTVPGSIGDSSRTLSRDRFRIPGSSPPSAVSVYSSSAQQLTDNSPLSSPPPTSSPHEPELESDALADAEPVLQHGVLMLPCPLCHGLVPKALLESFNSGRTLRWSDKVAFCQRHKEQEAETQRSAKRYPTIDWSTMSERMTKHNSRIEAILERREHSYYRDLVDENVASGQNRNAFCAVEGSGQAHAVPGYYGSKGAQVMQEHILETFSTRIRRLASTDKAIPRTGPAGYVQTVLAPELAVLLVMEDFAGIDAEKARAIIVGSNEVGHLLTDADEDNAS